MIFSVAKLTVVQGVEEILRILDLKAYFSKYVNHRTNSE